MGLISSAMLVGSKRTTDRSMLNDQSAVPLVLKFRFDINLNYLLAVFVAHTTSCGLSQVKYVRNVKNINHIMHRVIKHRMKNIVISALIGPQKILLSRVRLKIFLESITLLPWVAKDTQLAPLSVDGVADSGSYLKFVYVF